MLEGHRQSPDGEPETVMSCRLSSVVELTRPEKVEGFLDTDFLENLDRGDVARVGEGRAGEHGPEVGLVGVGDGRGAPGKVVENACGSEDAFVEGEPVEKWLQGASRRARDRSVVDRPPSPMARFRVMEERAAETIEELSRVEPDSRLLLGILCAQSGASSEAESHLRQVPSTDPHAEAARRTLERLRSAPPR